MIMGYERPVDIPVQSIYDKGMMQMYIAALLKDYEQGLAEEKEFMSNFGNFTSPIQKDIDYWNNNTIKPIADFLEKNPDAIRSTQGRAALRRLQYSIPYGELAKLRQSAETARQYKTLLAKGVADGTLDYNTAIKLDNDISTWNTVENGLWEKVAPTAQKSINQVLAPYIEDLYKRGYNYDPEESKKRPGFRVSTVSKQQIMDQLGQHAADIMRDPMMQLRVKESGMTPEEYINTELYQHMRDELKPKEEADPFKVKEHEANLNYKYQVKLQDRQWAHDDEKAAKAHEYKMAEINARYGKGSGKPGSSSKVDDGYSVSFHMYNQGNEAMGASEDVVSKKAKELTNYKFRKYMKDGKMPTSVINSSAYQQSLLKNEKYVKSQIQNDKINSYAKQHNMRTASMALATSIDTKAMLTYPTIGDVGGIALKDASGNFNGEIKAPKGTVFTIEEVGARRSGTMIARKSTNKGYAYKNAQPEVVGNTTDGAIYKLKAGGKNFIQQIEPDGQVHWYFGTTDGKWYHAGVYEESQAMSAMDNNFLNAHNQKTKPIVTPFPTDADYSDPMYSYFMQQMGNE